MSVFLNINGTPIIVNVSLDSAKLTANAVNVEVLNLVFYCCCLLEETHTVINHYSCIYMVYFFSTFGYEFNSNRFIVPLFPDKHSPSIFPVKRK